ncbi:MAG: peptide deformylase [Actinomycetia bacterium]|nr:peptide deformylase [Actinomycetes bacterium]
MTGTARKIVMVGDPVLRRASRPVTAFDDSLAALIEDMFASMRAADGVGLAAPQLGVDLAVFVYDCLDGDDRQCVGHVVNPHVVQASGPIDPGDEGCLSVPGPFASLPRPSRVTVVGTDRVGAPLSVNGTGLLARCLLHETDHLRGALYIDHLSWRRRRRALREMVPAEWSAS